MKKLYTLLLSLFTILQLQAQCNASLSTPYGYDANQNGIMFNITAGAAPITITSFDMNLMSGTYEIYYMPGSYVGSESTAGSWTKAGTAAVTSLGTNLPTPIPIALSITIAANTTYGFYITSNSGSLVLYNFNLGYTDIATNTDITIAGGASIGYPFALTIPNRSVNCTPHYTIQQPTITTTGTLTEIFTNPVSQNAALPYTATTNAPSSYSIDWNLAANTAGLADQASTNFAFTSGVGNLNTIAVPANLPAGTYTGNLTIRNAGNCTNATAQAITLKINPPVTCPADISVPNDAGVCGAVVNYTMPVASNKKLDVLVLGSNSITGGVNDVRQKLLTTNQFNIVDGIDIISSTPDLITLQKYDAVLLYTGGHAANSVQLGNILAQYIDGGGGIVDAAYEATNTHILGAYDTDIYRVLRTNTSGGKIGQVSLGTIELPSHPIMKDVISFNGGAYSYRNDSNILTPNSYVVAKYNNNDLLVMAKENVGPLAVRRVSLNFFPPSATVFAGSWNPTTDGAKLMANALKWVAKKGVTQTAGLASGAVFPVGTITNTFEYTDENNDLQTCSFDVIVTDNEAPAADLTSLPTITEQCEVTNITAPTATDNCLGSVTGTTTTTFPITASTTVVWTYSDGINTSTQNQSIIIADTTAPAADVTTLSAITEQCEVTNITAPTATDNCLGSVTGTTTTTFPITASKTVVWAYSDGTNTSTQNQSIVIADTTAPVADLTALPTIIEQCEVTNITAPTATDNCLGSVTGTTITTFPITASTTVVWTYTDGINTSTQNQNIVIADTSAPVADLTALPAITEQCEVTNITAPTATDNCLGSLTGTTTTTFPITASTTVVWAYSDGTNTSTQNQSIVIADTTAPVADLTALPTIIEQCEVTNITAPTATDNCLGSVTGTTMTTFPITASTTVVWTYSDGINTSTQNQTVVIADTTAPIADLTALSTITEQCEVTNITAPTATDNCLGSVTGTTTTTFPITASTTVVWTYSDGINTSTQNQSIIIADTTAPAADLTSLPAITEQCEVTNITSPTATDNCLGSITGTTMTTFPITASTTVVWTYSDGINTSTQNQTVVIADTTAPVADLTSLPAITEQCEVTNITAPTATDNCLGSVTGTTTTTFPITASTTVVWTYSDGINTSTQNQNVVIADTTAPVADLTALPTITEQCEVTNITAPTATDNCLGSVTGTTTTTFPITASTTVVWTYSDGINTSIQNQNIVIADNTAPVADLTTLPTITEQCEVTNITAPTATDNCLGSVTGTTTTTFPITASTTVVWTYSDGINTSTQNQNIVIADTTAPVADLTALPIITEQCEVTNITAPTATDNCLGIVTGTTTTTFPITASTTLVWTYSDGINTSTQNQNVVIADTTAPVITCISDQILSCNATIPDYTNLISVSDNCDTSLIITQNPTAGSPFSGEVEVEIEAKDNSGNSSKCKFLVSERIILADAGNDVYIKEGETVQLDAIASDPGSFKWNTAAGLSNLLVANPFANPIETTTYTVVFTSTDGCTAEDDITVFVEQAQDNTKYGFSPNDDGINDYWKIDTIEKYPDNEVYIYNRWGDLVYYTKNYDNGANVFSGIANRKRNLGADVLPEGTYFFDIKIKGTHQLKKTTGFLVLKR